MKAAMELTKMQGKFLLLQINDALFPIGGYSHSYGLETYIQNGMVHDIKTASDYIKKRLRYNLSYTELLAIRLAFEAAREENLDALNELEEIMEASRVPMELREAAKKLGNRFVKTLTHMQVPYQSEIFLNYTKEREGKITCHPCAYGVFCVSVGISEEDALMNYLYAQTSAMVTNCVKSIPLSQSDGQKMLLSMYSTFQEVLDIVQNAGKEMFGLSAPGFDLRSIQHERLYSRIYMS